MIGTTEAAARLAAVRARIAAACAAAGRPLNAVTLVAVGKTKPAGDLAALYEAGQRDFGENYALELEQKRAALPADIHWHFIGRVQTNKAKHIVTRPPALIHAVDSVRAAAALAARAAALNVTQPVLLMVNPLGEATKGGVSPGDVAALHDAVRAMPALAPRGLMAMPPADLDPRALSGFFAGVARLADKERDRTGAAFFELSMGMSADLEPAVAAGATIVRVGSALFGPRISSEKTA